jgi:TetR/AcrR family transcriptional regulator, transcriptional repressor for nem operon
MRYEKGHKETTRRRIVETAAARFRKDGIEGVGLADLMAEAGLTHGGFYSHFSSKEDLVRATVADAVERARDRFASKNIGGSLETWIRNYLRAGHRDHPERGCIFASLASELGRHSKTTKAGFTEVTDVVLSSIESLLPATEPSAERRKRAAGIFSTVMGALQLARAVNDTALSDEILEAGIASALNLARIKTTAS